MPLQLQQLGLRRQVEWHLARLHVAQLGYLLDGPRRAEHVGLFQVMVQVGMIQDRRLLGRGQRGQPVGHEVEDIAIIGHSLTVALGPQIKHRAEEGLHAGVQDGCGRVTNCGGC